MNKPRQFEETAAAAELLRQFFHITRSPLKTVSDPTNATEIFFDKQYLNIVEFLAPVGADLKRRTAEKRADSVAAFFDMTMKPRRHPQTPLVETIAQFLHRLQ